MSKKISEMLKKDFIYLGLEKKRVKKTANLSKKIYQGCKFYYLFIINLAY